jgi:predicted RNA-binding Zn-ribbon protein involved in translation (DUF1610 family)
MQETKVNCSSCGGDLTIKYRYTQMLVCPFCGQTNLLNVERLNQPTEKKVLADYGSILAVGKTGKIKGKNFYVLGRLRYDYPDGFWDEWLIAINDDYETECWLQEDEGDFVLFDKKIVSKDLPKFEDLKVGKKINIEGYKMFISEKNTAVINGGEGELPFVLKIGEKADFVDGIAHGIGIPLSLEYEPEGPVLYIGEEIDLSEISVNKN